MSRFTRTCTAGVFAAAVSATVLAPTATASSSAPPACSDASLRTTMSKFDAAAGSSYAHMRFRNVSGHRCVLRGFPRVQMVGHGDGTTIGATSVRESRGTPVRVLLRPGDVARSRLKVTSAFVYGKRCHRTRTDGYRIYAPHNKRSDYVARRGVGCANKKIKLMEVRPVRLR